MISKTVEGATGYWESHWLVDPSFVHESSLFPSHGTPLGPVADELKTMKGEREGNAKQFTLLQRHLGLNGIAARRTDWHSVIRLIWPPSLRPPDISQID